MNSLRPEFIFDQCMPLNIFTNDEGQQTWSFASGGSTHLFDDRDEAIRACVKTILAERDKKIERLEKRLDRTENALVRAQAACVDEDDIYNLRRNTDG